MSNVYVEPRLKARTKHEPIDHYVLEFAGDKSVDNVQHRTQEAAINAAKILGHQPLVARVRVTDKGKPDHWRSV